MAFKSKLLRATWKRLILRTIKFADARHRVELLYYCNDPWCMDTDREQFRFSQTSNFLQRQINPIANLLEIGCGEGHQTEVFQRVAGHTVSIDISRTAIARARVRCADVEFLVGDFMKKDWSTFPHQFDVVTACEVLYYMRDIPAALASMERIGRSVLATYVDSYKERIDPYILPKSGVILDEIKFSGTKWTCAFWRT